MPTVHDLRYTAYSRRAGNLWRLGMHDAALQDIDAILATDDIVMEQKNGRPAAVRRVAHIHRGR
jgi:hypothetical protein